MKPTEVLMEEHRGIEAMMDVLESILNKVEAGDKANIEHLQRIVEFFQIFADKCHHGKEEELLFPALIAAGIPEEGGPVAVMLTEHDQGRSFIKGMKEGIETLKTANGSSEAFVENAWNYIMLLRQHIDKEDNILFRMADVHIPQERQNALIGEFEKIETERIGEGKHEEYHELLHDYKKIYIP